MDSPGKHPIAQCTKRAAWVAQQRPPTATDGRLL